MLGSEARKAFFFEKKKQKAFISWSTADWINPRQGAKVFWSFFPKKDCLLALLLILPVAAVAEPIGPQPKLPTQKLTIVSKSGVRHEFDVEIATTPEEQEAGEMFRTNIPADSGMFFDWGTPRDVPMWMKNCPVPEDMVFIRADGRIARIAENTVPGSLANIPSGGAVRATLELQGGLTAKLNISVGDRIAGIIFPR